MNVVMAVTRVTDGEEAPAAWHHIKPRNKEGRLKTTARSQSPTRRCISRNPYKHQRLWNPNAYTRRHRKANRQYSSAVKTSSRCCLLLIRSLTWITSTMTTTSATSIATAATRTTLNCQRRWTIAVSVANAGAFSAVATKGHTVVAMMVVEVQWNKLLLCYSPL